MALTANRYLTLFLLFVTAAACYALGFTIGFWLLIAMGVVFELAFWFQLFFRQRRR
ncbi:MAG: hypothetical protein ACR2QU_03630 [Gammaproteobacteria bacterium]